MCNLQRQEEPQSLVKKKIMETVPEPCNFELVETTRSIELSVSAVVDFSKYLVQTTNLRFRDTHMFQTRSFRFALI